MATNVSFYDISENLKQIAVVEEDTLYVIKNFDDKKKIASNVSGIVSNSEQTGSICYIKVPDRVLTGADIVEDDCLESDANIQEPYLSLIHICAGFGGGGTAYRKQLAIPFSPVSDHRKTG